MSWYAANPQVVYLDGDLESAQAFLGVSDTASPQRSSPKSVRGVIRKRVERCESDSDSETETDSDTDGETETDSDTDGDEDDSAVVSVAAGETRASSPYKPSAQKKRRVESVESTETNFVSTLYQSIAEFERFLRGERPMPQNSGSLIFHAKVNTRCAIINPLDLKKDANLQVVSENGTVLCDVLLKTSVLSWDLKKGTQFIGSGPKACAVSMLRTTETTFHVPVLVHNSRGKKTGLQANWMATRKDVVPAEKNHAIVDIVIAQPSTTPPGLRVRGAVVRQGNVAEEHSMTLYV